MKACFRGKGLFSLLLVSVLLLSAGPSALAAGGGEQLDMLVPADPDEAFDPAAARGYGANVEAMEALLGWTDLVQVAVSSGESNQFVLGLKKDGTVLAAGNDDFGQCQVAGWTDVVQISAGSGHAVGLKKDGTVLAAGDNMFGQCDVASMKGLRSVLAGNYFTAGIDASGNFVFAGYREYDPGTWYELGDYPVSWKDLRELAARGDDLLCRTGDGTVLWFGFNGLMTDFQTNCRLADPGEKVTALAVGGDYGMSFAVELQAGGRVKVLGDNSYGQARAEDWQNLSAVAAGGGHVAGLKKDGTVLAVGNDDCGQCQVAGWTDVASLAAGEHCTLGLTKEGKLLLAGCLF